ncbi:MAG: TonB-dependent receptor plug domain-containing protein, partial [Bacteroidia bacterium]|nr:TonB-dependent receptor plug domain-containing protein [Bacteroidia bacterium]
MKRLIALTTLLICIFGAKAQNTIVGQISDDKGKHLSSVLVEAKGSSSASVLTDKDGFYSIKATIGDVLNFTTTDGKVQTIRVKQNKIDLVFHPFDAKIERGFNMKSTVKTSTMATGTAGHSQLEKSTAMNPENSLYGLIPGLTVLGNGGMVYDNRPTIQLRGIGSLNTSNPLILVDGVERPLDRLSNAEIESVTVLKDAGAVAIYGIRGANGVI